MRDYECATNEKGGSGMSSEAKPVMAVNPYNDKLINVEPLFELLNLHHDPCDNMEDVIKHIILNQTKSDGEPLILLDHFSSMADLFLFLYDIKNMLVRVKECEISIPKKRGDKNE